MITKSRWLAEQFERRFGRQPHLCDVIENGEICVKTGRHDMDEQAQTCWRCGKERTEMEETGL